MSKPAMFRVRRLQDFAVPRPPNYVRDVVTDSPTDVADLSHDDLEALANAMREELFANVRRRKAARKEPTR